MKWWQIVWLAAFGIWGNIVFFGAALDLFQGDTSLELVVATCLQLFTLPALGTYLLCAFLAWTTGRTRRSMAARRLRASRA